METTKEKVGAYRRWQQWKKQRRYLTPSETRAKFDLKEKTRRIEKTKSHDRESRSFRVDGSKIREWPGKDRDTNRGGRELTPPATKESHRNAKTKPYREGRASL
ncbi:hypothetical protein Nepgr_020458 [Nepenthes gracilis]|uniref:Uncharacterized protein n=1 Tax=Nepenthes gracilis TaxID=150966 RepID=A0AAD3SY44_NEPGR|nr:hypothetical protein Nepgr_020458 [Nepenthes gracilis]